MSWNGKFLAFRVQDPGGNPLSGATLKGVRPQDGWAGVTTSDPRGYLFANLELDGYVVTVSCPGFRDRTLDVTLLPNAGHDAPITIGLEPGSNGGGGPVGPLPPLITRGSFFALADGMRWTAIECTDFQLFQRYLNGEDIEPVLRQRHLIGFNVLRVLGMCAQMFQLDPRAADRYYGPLLDFFRLCASHGCWVEFVSFADATLVMPTLADQRWHWQAVGTAAQITKTVLLELVNEADQPVNALDTSAFTPIADVLCSHGSNGSQQIPVRPPWSYETFHTNDANEWPRKVGHNAMELSDGAESLVGSHVPILSNENTRCPDRFNTPQMAFDAAAGAALLCAGSCFHSVHGKTSELWSGVELECARAWVNGARSVPLEFQDGSYRHAIELETPDVLRAYQRVLGDGRAHTVLIHK